MWKCCPCFSKTYEAPEVLELDYRHSSLTEVPADVFTFERTLEVLDLGSNQISDLPPSLFHCHELKELDLCDNDLMTIPQAVGSLTRLCKLDLSRNGITDIADTIKNCKSLVYFDLSMNHLTKLPEGISQLVNLEELFLNDTYLEFLHANFGRLTKLKVLELRENSLQSLPKSMSRLHNLQRLDIGQNDLSEMPEVVGTMANLTELWCDNNSMRSIPKFIGNLTKLNCLDASQNEIQELAEEISKCTQLSDVTLNTNSLEGLPDSFAKLENITVLRLDCNSIQYLPDEFGNLKSLQELSIVSNILKTLPASIGLLRKLHTIYLDDNLLSELPKEIGSCTALSVLSVAKNRLKEIPSEVGHLSNLKVLTLSGNLIIHLPVSILNIPKLGALWLSESQSKPLLPLNKEIDPLTGQHVLTCYLLPQLPSSSDENRKLLEEENKEDSLPPRRSRPSIKFLTDMEPAVVENNLTKRGLLRAPTPYPKELRALAKHASHLRQSKELNGEVANMDEPEYEGDYTEEELNKIQSGGRETRNGLSTQTTSVHDTLRNFNVVDGSSNSRQDQGSSQSSYQSKIMSSGSVGNQDYSERLPYNGKEIIGLPSVPLSNRNLGFPNKSNLSYSTTSSGSGLLSSSSQPLEGNKKDDVARRIEDMASASIPNETTRFIGLPDVPDKSTRETYGNTASEIARKSPPPYHVAARRAAFFRSSGGAGSGRIESPTPDLQQQVRVSPIVGVRMFPVVVPGDGIVHLAPKVSISGEVTPSSPNVLNNNVSFQSSEQQSLLHNRMENQGDGNFSEHEDSPDGKNEDNQANDFNRTFTISKDRQNDDSSHSDIVSSMEENIDGGATPEFQKDNLGSKSLAETIETALEGVDKRTTEFLRNDGWEEDQLKENVTVSQISSDAGLQIQSSIPNLSSLSSPVPLLKSDFSDIGSSIMTRSNFSGIPSSSGNSSSGYSMKGPAVPPKPSPLMSRNTAISSNTASDRTDGHVLNSSLPTASSNSSKLESYSKIPMLNSSSQNKFITGHSFTNQVPSDASAIPGNSAPPQVPTSLQQQSTLRNYSNGNETNTSASVPEVGNPNTAMGSRIPKLPSFSSNPVSNVGNQQQDQIPQQQFKKPEVLAPKPNLTRPSRIPSFGAGDPKTKEPNGSSNIPAMTKSPSKGSIPQRSAGGGGNLDRRPLSPPQQTEGSNILSGSGLSTKIPRMGETSPEKQELKRSTSGSRIPMKLNDTSRTSSPVPSLGSNSAAENAAAFIPENNNGSPTSLSNIPPLGGSKIPSFGNRKPWIFGTHRNARVVPVEYKKVNELGFGISDAPAPGQTLDGQGIYVVSTDSHDSEIKVGDKILQVDGIDVSNMGLEIVKKILGNCQENINLLVSRHS